MQPEQTPSQEPAPSSATLLDALRRRLMPEVNAGAAQRLSDIGIGMLASGSPDFFTALGKGLQAGNAAETSRLQMLRQAAETEEQSADRKARLELERAKQAYEQDPNNPRTQAYLLQAQAAVRSADAAMIRSSRENQGVFVPIGTRTENGVTGVVSQNNVTGAIRFEPNVTPNALSTLFGRQQLDARTIGNYRIRADAEALKSYPLPGQENERRAEANRLFEGYIRAATAGTAPFREGTSAPTQEPGRIQSSLTGTPTRRPPTAPTE